MACCAVGTGWAQHIAETLTLEKGWNAVYLESTPDRADCETFFGALPSVVNVGCYLPSAYSDTAQYRTDGTEIHQQPVSYHVWDRREPFASNLKALTGGTCYLIYATNACSYSFYGTPGVPRLSWRVAAGTNGLLNIVAPSLTTNTAVAAASYFREGPAGKSAGIYQIGGTGDTPPR